MGQMVHKHVSAGAAQSLPRQQQSRLLHLQRQEGAGNHGLLIHVRCQLGLSQRSRYRAREQATTLRHRPAERCRGVPHVSLRAIPEQGIDVSRHDQP